jgi:hypothetical protein
MNFENSLGLPVFELFTNLIMFFLPSQLNVALVYFYCHVFLVHGYYTDSCFDFDFDFHCGEGSLKEAGRESGCCGQGKWVLHEGSGSHWVHVLLKDQNAE